MKTNLLRAIAFAMVMMPLYNCSVEPTDQLTQELETSQSLNEQLLDSPTCTGQNPKARITNNGTIVFNFRIYSTAGALLGAEGNLEPGETSDWKTFPDGQALFMVTAVDFDGVKVSHLMDFCTEVNLEIDIDNKFTNAVPQDISN